MRKKFSVFLGIVAILLLFGCQQIKEKFNSLSPEYEQIADVDGLLNAILEQIAKTNADLVFDGQTLVDVEHGLPHFERVSFSEIEHFDASDVVAGLVIRPIIGSGNPRLIVIVKATDKAASDSLEQVMRMIHSDQLVKFQDAGVWDLSLINDNKMPRQGNFLLYVTWEDSEELVKVFERHVR